MCVFPAAWISLSVQFWTVLALRFFLKNCVSTLENGVAKKKELKNPNHPPCPSSVANLLGIHLTFRLGAMEEPATRVGNNERRMMTAFCVFFIIIVHVAVVVVVVPGPSFPVPPMARATAVIVN